MGRMFLVDLAGSERLKKSKSVGLRAQEAKAINLSLHTLGMCVNARSDPLAQHVPFRDSKLTRLLQESLGGNAKVRVCTGWDECARASENLPTAQDLYLHRAWPQAHNACIAARAACQPADGGEVMRLSFVRTYVQTSMIIAVSDVREHADETFQSCVFGSRAILVRTAPTINQFLDISSLNNEIASQLQARLLVLHGSILFC
jgi:Kinesin motor domain